MVIKISESKELSEMGSVEFAKTIPEHNSYNPSLSINEVKKLISIAEKVDVKDLAVGALIVTTKDVLSDTLGRSVSVESLKKYYREFYEVYSKSSLLSGNPYLETLDKATKQ